VRVGGGRRGFSSWIWGWRALATVVRRRFLGGLSSSPLSLLVLLESSLESFDGVRSEGGRKDDGMSRTASG